MEKWKKKILQGAICAGLLCLIWGGYFFSVKLIRQNNRVKVIKEQAVTIDYNVLSSIEEVDIQKDKVYFSGWAFWRGVDNIGINMVLQPTDGKESVVLEVDLSAREDINNKFNLECGNCGFKAEINKNKLEKDRCYEVLLSLSYEEKKDGSKEITEVIKKIAANRFFYNGEMYRYNPKEFDTPKISDEHIQNIVKQGQLYVYDAENKVWVYQFGNNLFCIANAENVVPLEEVPSVPMLFYTFSDDLVPEDRKDRYLEKGYDNYEIYLDEEHCFEGIDSQYYVVSFELPEYPVTYVRMGTFGNRGEGWISYNEFQMDIDIE